MDWEVRIQPFLKGLNLEKMRYIHSGSKAHIAFLGDEIHSTPGKCRQNFRNHMS